MVARRVAVTAAAEAAAARVVAAPAYSLEGVGPVEKSGGRGVARRQGESAGHF